MNNSTLLQAERSLVAAAILDPKVFSEAALQYSQFFDARCQVAWKSIGGLVAEGSSLDEISVADNCSNAVSVTELSGYTTALGVVNTTYWVGLVREGHIQRGIEGIASDFNSMRDKGISGADMLTKVRSRLLDLENATERKLPTLGDLAVSECERIRATPLLELRGLPTGLGLERVVPGGIPRGKVTTLFGESGNFKTTVKNNIVLGMARAGFKVLDVSLEDADELTAHRFIASCTNLNYGKIAAQDLTEADRAKLVLPENAYLAAQNVILAGEILPNIDEVIRTARYYKYKCDLAAVVIDYVQLLESRNPRQTEKERLDEIMRKCQLAAKRDNIAYIIVSQVKQDVDQRADHRPRITDMIGSSAMRTASKLSIGVFRPALYADVPAKNSNYTNLFNNHPQGQDVYANLLELHFLKNVLGQPRVVVHCLVRPETGHITPFDMRPYR